MLRRLTYARLERSLIRAYNNQILSKGPVPKGVFWRSQFSQFARIDTLLSNVSKISPVAHPAIADIGCGYGAMLEFIQKTPRYNSIRYCGLDISQAMITSCKKRFLDQEHLFTVGKYPAYTVDFCLFSGTFNLCHTANEALWEDYIFAVLQQCWDRSRFGLILNLLCAPARNIQKQIFYADKNRFLNRATVIFGPTKARSTPNVDDDITFVISKT